MLELKNISVGYGRETVLDGVSLELERGKLTSVIGVNGCGKSTLLRAALGILPIKCGRVLIDGDDLLSLRRRDIAKRIAYLPQEKSTPDMTVLQMVIHGRFPYLSFPGRYTDKDRDIALSAMERVGISGLEDKPMHALSGGMRQNAYIAMALTQETDYILLDEPTTYLDIAHQLELMRILRGLADGGRGIVTVMHDLPLAFSFSDEIALIADSSTVIKASPAELAASPLIREIFGVGIRRADDGTYYYEA